MLSRFIARQQWRKWILRKRKLGIIKKRRLGKITRFPAPTVQKPLTTSTRTRPVLTSWERTKEPSSTGRSFFNRSIVVDTMFICILLCLTNPKENELEQRRANIKEIDYWLNECVYFCVFLSGSKTALNVKQKIWKKKQMGFKIDKNKYNHIKTEIPFVSFWSLTISSRLHGPHLIPFFFNK